MECFHDELSLTFLPVSGFSTHILVKGENEEFMIQTDQEVLVFCIRRIEK